MDSSVVPHWTWDRKVTGSSPTGVADLLLQGKFSVLTPISVSIPPHVTTVAHKRSHPFCQKCRWQVTAEHTCTQHTWLQMKRHCKLVHGCMVHTDRAPRRQQFHVAQAVVVTANTVLKTLQWIFKTSCVKLHPLI